jgi:tetratricopeptide (TPR) repeat protein
MTIEEIENRLKDAKGEERVDLLLRLAAKEGASNGKQSIETTEKAYALALELNYQKGVGECLHRFGRGYMLISEYQKAIDYFHQAINVFEHIGEIRSLSPVYSGIGLCKRSLGNYDGAVQYFELGLKSARESQNRTAEAHALNSLGTTFHILGRYQEAILYLERAIHSALELGMIETQIVSLASIGSIYVDLGDTDKGLDYLYSALKLSERSNYTP